MDKRLDAAIDNIDARATKLCEFLHEIEPGEPIEEAALKEALHDCANVTASMHSLKRVVRRLGEDASR